MDDKPLSRDFSVYRNGKLVHHLAYQNDKFLVDVLERFPHLVSAGDIPVAHILAKLGYTRLFKEVITRHPTAVDLLERKYSNHILHYLSDKPDMLKWFIPRCSQVNQLNKQGETPLSLSISNRSFCSYKILLENKADANLCVVTTEGVRIMRSSSSKKLKWLSLGAKHGMLLGRMGADGLHVPAECIKKNKIKLFKTLVKKKLIDLNEGGEAGRYPIFDIIGSGNDELLVWALNHGIDTNVRNSSWSTPAHVYLTQQRTEKTDDKITKRLLRGIDVDDVDGHGIRIGDLVSFSRASKESTVKTPKIKIPVGSDKHPSIRSSAVYSSSVDHIVFFLLTLLNRYPERLHLPLSSSNTRFHVSHLDNDLSSRIKWRLNAIQTLSTRLGNFIEYASPTAYYVPALPQTFPKDKLTVYILSLVTEHTNHSNVLIIDPAQSIVERFDPEGGEGDQHLQKWLEKLIRSHPQLKSFEFLRRDKQMLQVVESSLDDVRPGDPIGYCTAWCMWYVECRLVNPSVKPNDLMRAIHPRLMMKSSVRQHIRQYAIGLSFRRNQFVTSVLGQNAQNQEHFDVQESTAIQEAVDAWLSTD